MIGIFSAIKAAVLYVKAGTSRGNGNYELARQQIEAAKQMIGSKYSKPSQYFLDLRASEIYLKLGKTDAAIDHARKAMDKIARNPSLKEADRLYLQDFCEHLCLDAAGDDRPLSYRLHHSDYGSVSARYRRDYPLHWEQTDGHGEV